jgi:hypothetical protein
MSGPGQNGVKQAGGQGRIACILLHAPATALPTELLASLGKRIPSISTYTDSYLALAEVCTLGRSATVVLVLIEPPTLPDLAELLHAMRLHAPSATLWWYSMRSGPTLRKLHPNEHAPWVLDPADPSVAAPASAPASAPPTGPRLAPTLGPETPRLKPGGAPAFRPTPRNARSANDSPRVVVRPGGGIGIRRLRLVGDVPSPPQVPSVPAAPPPGPYPLSAPESQVAPPPHEESNPPARIPLLTEEELRMLLGDDEPGDTNGSTERSTR